MLSNNEIESKIADLDDGWELKDRKIVKSFQFSSFMDAIEFVNEIARIVRDLIITQLSTLTGRLLNFL